MRLLPRLLVVLVAVEIRMPVAWACKCSPWSAAEAFEAADSLYVARVVSVGGAEGCGATTAPVEFEVTEAFKGVEVGDVLVRKVSVGGSGSCAFDEPPYAAGEEFLLEGDEDETIWACNQGTPASAAQEDIETLRALAAAE